MDGANSSARSGVGGQKRARVDGEDVQESAKKLKQDTETKQVIDRWMTALARTSFPPTLDIHDALESLAQGIHQHHTQWHVLYDGLLADGECDVFVEIFKAQAEAQKLGTPLGWERVTVPGVGHDSRRMSQAAARLLFEPVK